MQITNGFALALPPDQAYRLLLDLEQVTPCMPGAELGEERDDGTRAVKVTVKLGPMRFVYDGTVSIAEQDEAARRAVMVGSARETRGQGGAKATITMTVTGDGSGSNVDAVADVELSGRAAQMGRGVVDDVAKRMIDEMARCLEQRFAQPETPPSEDAAPTGATASGVAPASSPREQRPLAAGSLLLSVLAGKLKALFRRSR